jgi:hypothetical protein
MKFEIDKKVRLTESIELTAMLNQYMVTRLDLLNAWRLEDKPKKDSKLNDHYERRIAAMVVMVSDVIDYVCQMDKLFDEDRN